MTQPLRILTWHVHGNYLYYLTHTPHELYLPVKPGRPEGYGGKLPGFPWPDNVHDVPADEVKELELDCILFQSQRNYEMDQFDILTEAQRQLPRIFLEHNPPREHPTNTCHPVDDPDVLLVHVTHFNNLMWDSGRTPTYVIPHGVVVPEGVRYSGEREQGIVVVNGLPRRGRYTEYQKPFDEIAIINNGFQSAQTLLQSAQHLLTQPIMQLAQDITNCFAAGGKVLVLNIGAVRGRNCPDDHWLYNPDAKPGFHRVGFYSNVDSSFLPQSSRAARGTVSIYIERAYVGGTQPTPTEVQAYCADVVAELQSWGFIEEAEVVDPTWIEVAYTWSWPGSRWKPEALRRLQEVDIFQVGRYGRWIFQGIADSIRDGFYTGSSLKDYAAASLSTATNGTHQEMIRWQGDRVTG